MTAETGDTWKKTLEEIARFMKEHGRSPSRYCGNDSEKKIAQWRHHYVSKYNRGLLSEERVRLIESSGVLPNNDDRIWLNLFERTKKFVDLYGRYPSKYGKSKEEIKCGRWRTDQALLFNKNRLRPDRKQLFKDAGLTNDIFERKWNRMLKTVVQFKKNHGRKPSSSRFNSGELKLANWCYWNNHVMKANPSANTRRATLLHAAGLIENREQVDPWHNQYDKLKAFCAKHSRLPLQTSAGAEKKLYQWYFDQQTLMKNGELNFEKSSKIETIKKQWPLPVKPPGS